MLTRSTAILSLTRPLVRLLPSLPWRFSRFGPRALCSPVPFRCNIRSLCDHSQPLTSIAVTALPTTDNANDVVGKMYIEFTCKKCNHRSQKHFSKHAYEKGIVIIRCDGCQNLHLIADNLGWIVDGHWKIEDVIKVDRGPINVV